jgi:hypothetical protein
MYSTTLSVIGASGWACLRNKNPVSTRALSSETVEWPLLNGDNTYVYGWGFWLISNFVYSLTRRTKRGTRGRRHSSPAKPTGLVIPLVNLLMLSSNQGDNTDSMVSLP